MKALVCEQFGPLDQLSVNTVPIPQPGPGQVLVKVVAVSLNFPDTLICRGAYQVKPSLPFSPGAELAGVITAIGADVCDWGVGDRVLASVGYGALAEYCVVDAWRLVALPEPVSFVQASSLVVAYGTVLHALQSCVSAQPGQTLLVLGAAGGVGTAAIQLGRVLGLKVMAAVSSPEKAHYCSALGAGAVVCYDQPETLKDQVMRLTSGQGVDLVLDPVGGTYGQHAFRSLAWRGCYLVLGFAAGEISRFPLNLALLQERRIQGVYWGEAIRKDPEGYRKIVRQLCRWVVEGAISAPISQVISLDQAASALQQIEQRDIKGKIVVDLDGIHR